MATISTTTTRTIRLPDDRREAGTADPSALVARFPALAAVPRLDLVRRPTPVVSVPDRRTGATLWVKREDLGAEAYGGNKVRPLEFLLAGVRPGTEVLTVGARGSTHALATAVHAASVGGRTTVVRWRQEMNPDAESSGRRCAARARCIDVGSPVTGFAVAAAIRLTRRVHWVPAGGTSPLGVLGHVDAALELAAQVRAGELPAPRRVVVPLGSGGTAAGLMLGLAIAGLAVQTVAVRVAPRVVANRRRVVSLAARCARMIERIAGERIAPPSSDALRVVGSEYGAGYGHPTQAGTDAARWLRDAGGPPVDATYSAKALAAALADWPAEGLVFWLTFDGRPEMHP